MDGTYTGCVSEKQRQSEQMQVSPDAACGQALAERSSQNSRSRSALVDAQVRAKDSLAEASKATRAVHFLSEHPEFDEFIQLVRAGVIQF